MHLRKLLALILMSTMGLIAACGGSGEAPAAENVVYEGDSFRFSYPSDLALREQITNVVTVGTSLDTVNVAVRPNPTYPEGEGTLTISVFQANGSTPEQYLAFLDEQAAQREGEVVQLETTEEFTTYGSNGVAYTLSGGGVEGKMIAFETENGNIVQGTIYAAPGELATMEERLLPILESVAANTPPALAPTPTPTG